MASSSYVATILESRRCENIAIFTTTKHTDIAYGGCHAVQTYQHTVHCITLMEYTTVGTPIAQFSPIFMGLIRKEGSIF